MLDKYLWLAFIAIGTAFIATIRSWLSIRGVRSGLVVYTLANLPWVFQGYGMLVDPKPQDLFHLMGPAAGWVGVALAASIIANWVALVWWVFWRDGAEQLAECAKVRRSLRLPESPGLIKAVVVVCILGGVYGLISMLLTHP